MSRLLMGDRHPVGEPREAEPYVLHVEEDVFTLITDDGERHVFNAHEFAAELDVEITADRLAQGSQAA